VSIAIDALRQAVTLAPDNVSLVEHLAEYLVTLNRFANAVTVYRDGLKRRPRNVMLQVGLADTYRRNGKLSHAHAIIKTLTDTHPGESVVLLLHAGLKHATGESVMAGASYREAIDFDPEARDEELESLIGYRDVDDSSPSNERVRNTAEGFDAPTEDDDPIVEIERPTIGLESVGGMDAVKAQVRIKLIYPLEHADMFAAYGKMIGGGVLMYGPPGFGKTQLDRATAGEVKASFLSVGYSDVLDMWVGKSEYNLHGIFEFARRGKPQPLRTADLLVAAKTIRPSTKERFSTARNHALYSNQGGVYDDILDYLKIKR